ncbi:MAG: UDP-N-acetylmuramoyl-L-alanyl-D-glutamate--2,6-diaminopimelate ligase [Ruminococcus sp.]|nr:UDP-N-acetylmuramoyl-L-alanyl-D-glutamate--2,6-diaminopimelate ligase [Ruminococcus sp.]
MKLSELVRELGIDCGSLANTELDGLTSDNRVTPGKSFAFVCIKGNTFDGHSAAAAMVEKGAAAVFCEHDLGLPQQIIVEDTRGIYPHLCSAWFGHPEREVKMLGVTGTNGKTTITTTLKKTLMALGRKSGLIGTCQNEIGDEVLPTARTTPEPYDLFELLRKMADAGCEYVVMEVSSQGLEQKRTGPCRFELAVFTNLTQDHLDVHGTMENYYQAKKLLFDISGEALINIDDDHGRRYLDEITIPARTYSAIEPADYYAESVSLGASGVKYVYCCGGEGCDNRHNVTFAMPGLFNVSNSLAVIAVCDMLGIGAKAAVDKINSMTGVRGRAEVIPTGRDFTVICDYAHTPDAVSNVLRAIRNGTEGRLVCLFGCGGNRDAKKRPLMAKAAAENADFLIVTSDNPRNEDPDAIIEDILKGLEGYSTPYTRITDRREAIFYAVRNARAGDVIVLAGKGHEDYQILAGGKKIHFDEREIVAQALGQEIETD